MSVSESPMCSMRSVSLLTKALVLSLLLVLCLSAYAGVRLRLATTTSTENSGLLEVLLPPFEGRFGIKVDVIPVGTGKALKLAENGDVDLVLVHCPEAEEEFISSGYGVNRREVMHNDFLVLGPPRDPAGIRGMTEVVGALRRIAHREAPFVSRGDDSGTHSKEKTLWNIAECIPKGRWYMETGQGMGATLQIASEKSAYTLADRATFLTYKEKLGLVVLSEGDLLLYNPYSIIAVNPSRHPHVNYLYAIALIGWVTSQEGQNIIRNYRKLGQQLFYPDAIR